VGNEARQPHGPFLPDSLKPVIKSESNDIKTDDYESMKPEH
jgi:hypothetical protein